MKQYDVLKVVKKEERLRNFAQNYDVNKRYNDEDWIMPALIVGAAGASFLALQFQYGSAPLSVTLISGGFATFGFGRFLKSLDNLSKFDRLSAKLDEIYEQMGPDFQKQVEEELGKRQKSL